jgi:hypothetical protein
MRSIRRTPDPFSLLFVPQCPGKRTGTLARVTKGLSGDCGVGMWGVGPAMEDFTFKVNFVAVVRVRAGDESVACKIVPTLLGAPGTAEIRLANERNAAKGRHATVTDVDFSIGSVVPARNRRPRTSLSQPCPKGSE